MTDSELLVVDFGSVEDNAFARERIKDYVLKAASRFSYSIQDVTKTEKEVTEGEGDVKERQENAGSAAGYDLTLHCSPLNLSAGMKNRMAALLRDSKLLDGLSEEDRRTAIWDAVLTEDYLEAPAYREPQDIVIHYGALDDDSTKYGIIFSDWGRAAYSLFYIDPKEAEECVRLYKHLMQESHASEEPIELSDSWEEIIAASKDGTYKDKYQIGDTKELDMGEEGIITMKLVAMDEDDLADGSGKAPMTWVADELLKSEHNMNDTDTNKGDWAESGMRSWLRSEIFPLMPEEVPNSIREVKKYSYSLEEGKAVRSDDTIWIPSVREVFPADYEEWVEEYYEKEGVAYTEIFKDNESRIRSRADASGASWWWLRSADFFSFDLFLDVSCGGIFYYDASREGGVLIGFCL